MILARVFITYLWLYYPTTGRTVLCRGSQTFPLLLIPKLYPVPEFCVVIRGLGTRLHTQTQQPGGGGGGLCIIKVWSLGMRLGWGVEPRNEARLGSGASE